MSLFETPAHGGLKKKPPPPRNAVAPRAAKNTVRDGETRYRHLFEALQEGIWISDEEGYTMSVNPSLARMLGYSADEMIGRPMFDFMHEAAMARFGGSEAHPATEAPAQREVEFLRKDGSRMSALVVYSPTVDDEGNHHGGITSVVDITERKKMEARLRQAQKMEAIGRLSGGIAHTFNNLMSIVLGNAELAMDDLPTDAPVQAFLDEIKSATLRGKGVIEQLLSFCRTSRQEGRAVDLARVVGESLERLRADVPPGVLLRADLPDALCPVTGRSSCIHQILANLCSNAFQAVAPGNGVVEVAVRCLRTKAPELLFNQELPAGEYIVLSISDNGCGIDDADLERVFEPFFTTREVGMGIGMGLAVAHGLMMSHGGGVRMKSRPGRGTVVECFFPRRQPVSEQMRRPPPGHPVPEVPLP